MHLKITFDPGAVGHALVLRPPRKRRVLAAGQWVVFDKDEAPLFGAIPQTAIKFHSHDIGDCHDFCARRTSPELAGR